MIDNHTSPCFQLLFAGFNWLKLDFVSGITTGNGTMSSHDWPWGCWSEATADPTKVDNTNKFTFIRYNFYHSPQNHILPTCFISPHAVVNLSSKTKLFVACFKPIAVWVWVFESTLRLWRWDMTSFCMQLRRAAYHRPRKFVILQWVMKMPSTSTTTLLSVNVDLCTFLGRRRPLTCQCPLSSIFSPFYHALIWGCNSLFRYYHFYIRKMIDYTIIKSTRILERLK